MAPWCIYISCFERAARYGSGRDSVRGSVGAMNAKLSRPDGLATVQSGRKQAQSRVCTPGFSVSGAWECGLTEIHYLHDWYNVRNARLMVEHAGKMETDTYYADGYYGSAKMLVRTLNDGVKGGSVKFSYDPVTQKVCVHMKGNTTFMLYGDLPDKLGFGRGDGVFIRTSNCRTLTQGDSIIDLRRGFESLYVYSSIVDPRIVGDKIAPLLRIVPITGRHGEIVTARFDHVQYMPVLSREFGNIETEIRDDTGRTRVDQCHSNAGR